MKVSVIVPLFNAEKVLSKCIRSIRKQTYEDIEIILVNDRLADSSLRICQKHKREDDRIILIDKENEGAIKARQCGLEESSGDYVVFVDADDWVHPSMIETLSKHVKEEDLDLSVCNTYWVIGGRGVIKKRKITACILQRTSCKDQNRSEQNWQRPICMAIHFPLLSQEKCTGESLI